MKTVVGDLDINQLNHFKAVGDSLADSAVAVIFKEQRHERANSLLKELLYSTDDEKFQELHPQLQHFLKSSRELPPWADQDRIIRGQELFNQFSPLCLLSLILASLPECYANSRVAEILGETQRLESRAYKRIIETAQFLFYTMIPDGLEGGRQRDLGVRAIQRVRLIHAAVRYLVKEADDANKLPYSGIKMLDDQEQPISQLDLAYTLQTFAHVTLRSLKNLGVVVDKDLRNDYLHSWNVIGYLLGIEPELLVVEADDAELLFDSLKEGAVSGTEDGKLMTEAVLHVMKRMLKEKLFLVGWLLSISLPRALLFNFLDKATRDLLGVRKANVVERFLWFPLLNLIGLMARVMTKFLHVPLAGKLNVLIGHWMIKYLANPPDYLGKANFAIPKSLDIE